MKCADPVLCYEGKYRHYSLATPVFRLLAKAVFNCGQCIFCRKRRASELALRCVLHASLSPHNCFLTLTYDEKQESYHNNFEYADIQKFKKKLRRHCEYHYNQKIQVFNVHEYGKHGKKHWHLVVFGWRPKDLETFPNRSSMPIYCSRVLQKIWTRGFSSVGDVTEASALYQAQYTQKDVKNGNLLSSKQAHSKHSGIGRDYFLQHYDQILRNGFVPHDGRKFPVPRYFVRIAHKHYSHFFATENFFDTPDRKRLYVPFNFRNNWPNIQIANLYQGFIAQRQKQVDDLILDWDDFINEHAFSKETPDFRKAAENYLYDLDNKKAKDAF